MSWFSALFCLSWKFHLCDFTTRLWFRVTYDSVDSEGGPSTAGTCACVRPDTHLYSDTSVKWNYFHALISKSLQLLPIWFWSVYGCFLPNCNKKILLEDFSKVSHFTYRYCFACRDVNTLEYVGIKLLPRSTKIVPTAVRWSWYRCC